jgi:hypothetical protein
VQGKIFFSVNMMLETGKYFDHNQKKLDSVSEGQWAAALKKCRDHIILRLKKRTLFGAHTLARLGEEAEQYYTAYAFEAILAGTWQWKDEYTLSEQMVRIADSTISTEVEKMESKREKEKPVFVAYDDIETMIYEQDVPDAEISITDKVILEQKILFIEENIKGIEEFEYYWECIKEGMKPADIAAFMNIAHTQLYKLRDRFVRKIKSVPYFEIE